MSHISTPNYSGSYGYATVVWDDIRVAAQATKQNPVTSKPDFDNFGIGSMKTYLFDDASKEAVHFTVQIPHGYKLGTDLCPHVHWCPTTTNAGSVLWELEYTLVDIGGTFPSESIVQADDPSNGTAHGHQIASLSTISGSGISNVSAMFICQLSRRGDLDNYPDDAALLEFDFHFQKDSDGSIGETFK